MNVYSEIAGNKTKTCVALVIFFLIASAVLYVLGKAMGLAGPGLFLFAFLISMGANVVSYYYSDKIVLKLHSAKEADRKQYFDLYTVTENLAIAAGIPKPKVYIIQENAPNAFATGRDYTHSVVVVTTGLLELLDRRELEGVIAHELSHIKNYDMLLMTVVSVVVGLIVYATDFFMRAQWFRNSDDNNRQGVLWVVIALVMAIIAPLVATLLQLAISRKREFLADASGAYITRNPEALALALEKLSISSVPPMSSATNATAHLFFENPFGADRGTKKSWLVNLFSTHPPLSERIAKLRTM